MPKQNTSTVCYDINACIDENDNGIRELRENVGGNEDCDFCVFVTTKVKEILSGGPTEIEIRTLLEDGCHSLGSFEKEVSFAFTLPPTPQSPTFLLIAVLFTFY